ncbi:MAG: acetyl-CoA carboxylase biotin carboxyl carrier protein subunit [Bacteroidetes bacterium]|jgi:glutaconyl-CoA/methylmalonyl-CoA decarboxylase subunit gamma|nr:acetyl-CoA carboxylase biotin carboxyl carrier protein subunit [Bacteroidota bacterium]MBT3749946.1 acetyl-CoA carboxylase biotin carboxyl carrier protein subunit [Bacteroidota bacterium]MBT4398500.1 acetyl-CoA carboxylase biotin carboxyl carrier protein subunit [Bacteroidota bacterium]MBT4408571.1 acetyl-CoA carboxylase biotin carboxyl carrier protein subunit [Bacteroidota bacterium]MBT5425851.1 acetyl-CoA carboxylase biotin carboxyl carrier protein subunit [Bacteroidota bacterium]
MKKFKFKIQGNPYEVEIKEVEGNVAVVEVNGTTYDVEVQKEVIPTKTPTLIRKRIKAPENAAKISKTDGVTLIKAPLPGNIMQVTKKTGDVVAKGDMVLIYEAMKMENKVLAEKDGTIGEIKVSVGDAVLQGDLLFEII